MAWFGWNCRYCKQGLFYEASRGREVSPSNAALLLRVIEGTFCRRQPPISEHLYVWGISVLNCDSLNAVIYIRIGVHRPQGSICNHYRNLGIKWTWQRIPGWCPSSSSCYVQINGNKHPWRQTVLRRTWFAFKSRDWVLRVFIMYKLFLLRLAWVASHPQHWGWGTSVRCYGPR